MMFFAAECLQCVQRRMIWVKPDRQEVCVSDFSQVDGEVIDFAATLDNCRRMYGIQEETGSSGMHTLDCTYYCPIYFAATFKI